MHANFIRFTLRQPLAAGVLEFSDQFLLFGVDGERRAKGPLLACSPALLD
jgi:hypothetical protein